MNPSQRFHFAWVVLGAGTLVVFASLGLARFGYGLVLPAMQLGLGLDNTQAGALATAGLAGYLVMAVLGGILAARFGPRRVIVAGLGLTGVAMLLTGLARSGLQAALCQGLAGLGSGASNVPVMGLLAAWFARKRRGLAAGIAVTGSSLGLIVLGPLVPRILDAGGANGWRVCWSAFGVMTLVVAGLAFLLLRNHPSELGLRPFGADEGSAPPAPAGPSPVRALDWGTVYRSSVVWHLGAVYTAFGFSYIIYMTFFFKSLIADVGYSRDAAGALFMAMGWASLFCGLLWGAVSDRMGRKRALAGIYVAHMVAFALFALWQSPTGFMLSALLFGLCAWSIPAVMSAACGDLLGARLAPAGLGFITLFFGLGQLFGPTAAGALADQTASFAPAYLLAAGAALLGALGAATLPEAQGACG